MSISIKSIYTLLLPLFLFLITGCVDDRLIHPDNDYRDGETVLSLEANFRPFTEGDLTRSDIANGNGKALADIKSMQILVFDTDGVLLSDYTQYLTKDKLTVDDKDRKPQGGNPIAETSTKTVSDISLKLPFGEYYIIGVANPKNGVAYDKDLTLEALFNSKVVWKEDEAGDISGNGEMLGYFTDSGNTEGWPLSISQIKTVKINRPGMNLHAWMRRCASKITIDFDGSQLRDKVTVYIKQAKIYDIPYDCTLGFGSVLSSTGDGATGEVSAEGNPSETGKTSYNNSVSSEDYGKAGGFFGPSKQVISYLKEETSATRAEDTANSSVTTPTDDYDGWENWPSVTKASPYLYDENDKVNFHSETAQALYFYENMQDNSTEPKKTKTALLSFEDGGMVYNRKDGMTLGTYIEVEAYYKSEAIGNVSQGIVRYRFMLGKNATDNFEAERNYHYKLTLKLKGNGNDGDWHIDFKEQVLEVTQPKEVNYQGQFFEPTDGIANMGHTFSKDNVITVTSYMDYLSDAGQTTQMAEAWTLSYMATDDATGDYPTGENAVFKAGLPEWINYIFKDNAVDENTGQLTKELIFTTSMRKGNEVREVNINDDLKKSPVSGTYNLSNSKGENTVQNTANCYIVKGSGTYQIPLVYGNAVTNGTTYEKSYKTGALSVNTTYPNLVYPKDPRDFSLPNLKNHLNNDISSPYIEKNEGCTPSEAILVWQDESDLISGVSYKANELTAGDGTIGAIEFSVANGTIKEGNAVVAIKDSEGRIMWSWHIWVTNFSSLEETIKMENVSLSTGIANAAPAQFEVLPVNLGWCSGGEKILYYPERRCKIKFTAGTMSREIEIIQRSHMAFPRGNNVYYQWGRKDPFWGAGSNNGNKQVYPSDVADDKGYPKRFYADGMKVTEDLKDKDKPEEGLKHKRQTTYFLYKPTEVDSEDNVTPDNHPEGAEWYFDYTTGNRLIQQPDRWHNPPRKASPDNTADMTEDQKKYISQNTIYYNLWGQTNPDTWVYEGVKTVYDPTPAGYIVPHYALFTCFTTSANIINGVNDGQNYIDVNGEEGSRNWYEVSTGNIAEENRWANLFEFYTGKSKLQSVIFPESGYRDWDATAKIIDDDVSRGFTWSRLMSTLSWGGNIGCTFDPDATSTFPDCAYNFRFSRSQKEVWQTNQFNTCNGMAIRPVKIAK